MNTEPTAYEQEVAFKARGIPAAQGLYDPAMEKDACGVGFICNLNGEKAHELIHQALVILQRLTHRGACSCDNRTGDGAGLCIQLPHEFCAGVAEEAGFRLPDEGDYGTGLVFFSKDAAVREWCRNRFEEITEEEGQVFLGWRDLPVDRSVLGDIAAASEPHITQAFVGRSSRVKAGRDFERVLYMIRKRMEKAAAKSGHAGDIFYMPSLSSRTMIFKGLLQPDDFEPYFKDLLDPRMKTCLALVHQRYSTNTFPAWKLAQPFRFVCHNGEINTLRSNVNWMNAREALFKSEHFGDKFAELFPICVPGGSDSAMLDNTLELLYHTGRSLPHAMMMMVPEAWQNHKTMPDEKKAFYEYHSCLMEPWDGPALLPFTDGTFVGAMLDRNGLRPARWILTRGNQVILSSETGVIEVPPQDILRKGRLEPGRMFLINIEEGRIVEDQEVKEQICRRQPYRSWLNDHILELNDLPSPNENAIPRVPNLLEQQRLFGYTAEDLRIVMRPMAFTGVEALGSMGVDTPVAVLSDRPQLVYNYFKQLFAQVTNPPLDAIREELVTSTITNIGSQSDLFGETPGHCRLLKLRHPILLNSRLQQIRECTEPGVKATTLPMLFKPAAGGAGLRSAIAALCDKAEKAIAEKHTILILSDRGAGADKAPIPALLATSAVHHHLIRKGVRSRCGLVIETGEAREVHHFACLMGYGAGGVNPYLAFETIGAMVNDPLYQNAEKGKEVTADKAVANYIKAVEKGVVKVMSKMGVSTLQSYRGAQIFEAIGLGREVIDLYFTGTPSRIAGAGLDELAEEAVRRYAQALPTTRIPENLGLEVGGLYQWRRTGEHHLLTPSVIASLQRSTKVRDRKGFQEFSAQVNDQSRKLCTLRGLMEFHPTRPPVPLEEVEPWTEIVKRFKTGAMSYGSISREAHETLAVAMNRIGGKSNSGEGGEETHRYGQDENGDSRSSAIKQVASGRFGVTSYYLANAKEIQIKMAQGAKPGEGGQLPGSKVSPPIAKARHSTPYVGLVSPPPHHDIYSIEDLSQLIFDLKMANPSARINVKLVSEVGVGTIAAGVSKGRADVILISGWDGGTGASPETSLKHAGIPWELGLSEAQQTLVLNNLRGRVVLEVDGKLMTGRDVAIAALLGAEEFGFSTAPLMVMGCIMMRVCHLNTCPVGIATQNPELRRKFKGMPDAVINFFHLVAEDLREIMASLGFRTLREMTGQVDNLEMRKKVDHFKAKHLDLSAILAKPRVPESFPLHNTGPQDHGLDKTFDARLVKDCAYAIESAEPVNLAYKITNVDRAVGTTLSHHISRKYRQEGLPDDTVTVTFNGSAGQSFCAFGARGLNFTVIGDANDYFGKGLSGAKLALFPHPDSPFDPGENIILGNVALYGATAGEAYIRGIAGERFGVRNSGAVAVVEGVGDHGCEYMTGGRVVVLGPTGRNFAAGMSGGIAYILDEAGDFAKNRCNAEMVQLETVGDEDAEELRDLIQRHLAATGSEKARKILRNWADIVPHFVKIMPTDYKLALERIAREQAERRRAAAQVAMDVIAKQE